MKISVLLFTLAASAFTLSPARATSLTISFPTAGDTWGEIASGTSGTLSGGGYTGRLKSAGSYVTSSGNTYPVLDNFVATGFTATYNIYNTQYDTIDYSIGGSTIDIALPGLLRWRTIFHGTTDPSHTDAVVVHQPLHVHPSRRCSANKSGRWQLDTVRERDSHPRWILCHPRGLHLDNDAARLRGRRFRGLSRVAKARRCRRLSMGRSEQAAAPRRSTLIGSPTP